MSTSLHERFSALADQADDSSWAEVFERAGRLQRRRPWRVALAMAAAVAFIAVAVSSAVSLGDKVVHLFGTSEPAPQRVVKSFGDWDNGVPPGLGSGVEADRAIKVLATPAGEATLWLAPRRDGGFCTLLNVSGNGVGGGCERLEPRGLSLEVGIKGLGQGERETVVLNGETADPRADSLLLHFADGTTARPQLVWVTAPVDAGFFVYVVPDARLRPGHRPTTLTLYAADGDVLGTRDVNGLPPLTR
jgi:hypothetical protein